MTQVVRTPAQLHTAAGMSLCNRLAAHRAPPACPASAANAHAGSPQRTLDVGGVVQLLHLEKGARLTLDNLIVQGSFQA